MIPKDYIDRVDKAYAECRNKKLSRFSDEWDSFSRVINKERLEFVKGLDDENEKDESLLSQCLAYWFNRSEMLDLRLKNKLVCKSKIKKLAKEGSKIKRNILNGTVDTVLGTKGIVELFAKHHRTKGN